ncbi:hypothetical protein FKW77_009940 [Venturia effusa]|uniref:DUF7357 domain-containing protein n=1 Tax=Venturia effusa TaxID=50376 RepID=A0A517L677_9PEZI|nr:hypothetical protein FKW77_009940 [Venturia effusa]
MRIRLCVRRNGLPDANVVWPATEQVNGSKQKIADLLTAVNETMPLESLNWTLEDYVVEISGFECLHWQFLGDVLKDEDHVTIRPMEQVEVRARQLSGRHQISSAGFHLVDGFPFGTRPLRPLPRPSVVIPPRKRRRISTDETDASPLGTIQPGAQLSIADVDNDEQQLALLNSGDATLREGSADVSDERPPKRAKTNKRVHFSDMDEDDDDDEDDEDFNDFEDASSSDTDSESDSDSDNSSDSDSSESEAPSEEDLHQAQEQDTSRGFDQVPARPRGSAPPNMGLTRTRDRNKRRQNSKRLAHLVRIGALPPNSTAEDLRKFLNENERSFRPGLESLGQSATTVADSSRAAKSTKSSKGTQVTESGSSSSDSDSSDSSSDSSDSSSDESDDSDDSKVSAISHEPTPPMKSTTSATISNGGFEDHTDLDHVDTLRNGNVEPEIITENGLAMDFVTMPQDKHKASYIISGNSETPTSEHITTQKSSSALEAIARRQLAVESAPKRARLNLDGARRTIFGNLGQRTPNTKADEERVRAKLANIGRTKTAVQEEKADEEIEPESEAWRSKIKVMACECIDGEAIVLSEPPYPFVQRWDPQQQHERKKKPKNKNKKRKDHDADYEDEYEGENCEGNGYDDSFILNYDEEDLPVFEFNDDTAEQATLADDLQPLPADISTLPIADLQDMRPGTILTFRHLEMGKNFMPEMTDYRTAIVEPTTDLGTVEKGFLLLRLAKRDRKAKQEKKYDGQGNRVYEKFEMPMGDEGDESGDEEDDGFLETNFRDLVDARILKLARVSESEKIDDAAARQLLVEAGAMDAEVAAEGNEG